MPTIEYRFPLFNQPVATTVSTSKTTHEPNSDGNLFGSFEIVDEATHPNSKENTEHKIVSTEHKPSLIISEIFPTPCTKREYFKCTPHRPVLTLESLPKEYKHDHGLPSTARPKSSGLQHTYHTPIHHSSFFESKSIPTPASLQHPKYKVSLQSIDQHSSVSNYSIESPKCLHQSPSNPLLSTDHHNQEKPTPVQSHTTDHQYFIPTHKELPPLQNPAAFSNQEKEHPTTRNNQTLMANILHPKTPANQSKPDSEQALFGSIDLNANLDSNALSQHFSKSEERAEVRDIMNVLNCTSTDTPYLTARDGQTLAGRFHDEKWRAREYERAIKNKARLEELHGKPTTWQDLIREKQAFERMVLRDASNDYRNNPKRFTYFDIATGGDSVTVGNYENEEDYEEEREETV